MQTLVKIGCVFSNIFERKFHDDDALFQALLDTIAAARRGGRVEHTQGSQDNDRKIKRLVIQGVLAVTLARRSSHGPQLRVWVEKPCFRKNGQYVDGYGEGCIFEAYGDHDTLEALAEKYFGYRRHRFDDRNYVLWI